MPHLTRELSLMIASNRNDHLYELQGKPCRKCKSKGSLTCPGCKVSIQFAATTGLNYTICLEFIGLLKGSVKLDMHAAGHWEEQEERQCFRALEVRFSFAVSCPKPHPGCIFNLQQRALMLCVLQVL